MKPISYYRRHPPSDALGALPLCQAGRSPHDHVPHHPDHAVVLFHDELSWESATDLVDIVDLSRFCLAPSSVCRRCAWCIRPMTSSPECRAPFSFQQENLNVRQLD